MISSSAVDDPEESEIHARDTIALCVEDVSVRFGGLQALLRVGFEVAAQEIVSIIGPNGAGKSTLLNAICGLVPKSSGHVHHFGVNISRANPTDAARAGVGRSFQDPQLLEDWSVLENIVCGSHLVIGYGLLDQIVRRRHVHRREAAMKERALELLELVGLLAIADIPVSQLSYGARKIVDILRAAFAKPRVLLLDEPSSGLDVAERRHVEELLHVVHNTEHIPMLVVEHHMDLVRSVSDRVIGLYSGAVAISGTPSEVLDSEEMRDLTIEHFVGLDDLAVARAEGPES